ncbi:MAG TPA: polysaccharide deacetylase family protein [Rubricoccaceae bacterium]|nr:polysaccharide deacetylase family protein [Rubricoccaceae bacterium]
MGRPLPCCVEGPDTFLPKARYALDTLLTGLSLEPLWTDREGLGDGGLYYGPEPGAVPATALRFRLAPETAAYFAARTPYDPHQIGSLSWNGTCWPLMFLFGADGGGAEDGVLEVDPIASAFYWLAGWDEHTTTARDAHGRFPYEASLHARLGTIRDPLVDVYRGWLGDTLQQRGVPVERRLWAGKAWAVALTHDVDFVRTWRLRTLVNDPRQLLLDGFVDAAEARGASSTFFLKAGATAREDVPYRLASPDLLRLLGRLQEGGFEVGFHPSYFAHDHPGHLRKEHDRLAAALGAPPTTVRQHYLRWTAPTTPRLQAAAGLALDSTLGFAAREGFRRATACPFRLFDLDANAPLDLWELPLSVMDTTLFAHRGLQVDEAEAQVEAVFAACRRVGGCAVLLWHNEPYTPHHDALLGRLLDRALNDGALVAGLKNALSVWEERLPA